MISYLEEIAIIHRAFGLTKDQILDMPGKAYQEHLEAGSRVLGMERQD